MKTDKTNEGDKAGDMNKKLDDIIEKSKTENEALKKILSGLDKMNDKQTKKKNIIKRK